MDDTNQASLPMHRVYAWLWKVIAFVVGVPLVTLVATSAQFMLEATKQHVDTRQVWADLSVLRSALTKYAAGHGEKYPKDQRELETWASTAEVRLPQLDPWGNGYLYVPSTSRQHCRVLCLGSDGRPGGRGSAADIIDEIADIGEVSPGSDAASAYVYPVF